MSDTKITPTQINIHRKLSDKTAEEQSRGVDFEAAAKALIMNTEGYKKSGNKVYIETPDGKKTEADISVWLEKLDSNKDGIITAKEVEANGGDKYNLLKMSSDEKIRQKISKDIDAQQQIHRMKNLEKGLTSPGFIWGVAKGYIVKYSTKEGLTNMLSNNEAREYYNKTLWGTDEKSVNANSSARKRMKDLLSNYNFTADDYKKIGFTNEQIKYFTDNN